MPTSEAVTRDECRENVREIRAGIERLRDQLFQKLDEGIAERHGLRLYIDEKLQSHFVNMRALFQANGQPLQIKVTLASGAAGGAIVAAAVIISKLLGFG